MVLCRYSVGFIYAFHLTTFWQQGKPHQTDIQLYGFCYAYSFILCVNVIVAGIVLLNMKYVGIKAVGVFIGSAGTIVMDLARFLSNYNV